MFLFVTAAVAAARPGYRAAVVEFAPTLPGLQNVGAATHNLANLAAASVFIAAAAANGSAIVVLPEYGITGSRPSRLQDWTRDSAGRFSEDVPEPGAVACGAASAAAHPVTSAAACLARKHGIVLAINLLERVRCDTCADGRRQYNTAVVLDARGAILAKYRKYHLYGSEPGYLDRGRSQNGTQFRTAFGVRFGLFICFDIKWETHPSAELRDFLFPTAWPNLAGYANATEAQRAWSMQQRRVLLAANYGGFGRAESGSGIWRDGQPLAEFNNPTAMSESRLLVADVPAENDGATAAAQLRLETYSILIN